MTVQTIPDGRGVPRQTRVFLSYSRQDQTFVEQLREVLLAHGYEAYFDLRDVAPGEEWRSRLDQLILSADATVLLVTNFSLASEVCAWEVDRTLDLGKRLIPLVHGPCTHTAPKRLSALNYIFTDDPLGGATIPLSLSRDALQKIRAALDLDIAWVREHTRLIGRAEEWEKAPEANRQSKLLRRGEIELARSWIRSRAPATISISDSLLSFLDASEDEENAASERLLTITGRAFVKPVDQSNSEERHDAALRRAAAGIILSDDLEMRRVPQLAASAVAAARNLRLRSILRGHESGVWRAEFSSDGSRVLTASSDGSARIWDVHADCSKATLLRHQDSVRSAHFNAQGTLIVTTTWEADAHVWDAVTAAPLAVLRGHEKEVYMAVFSPDGNRIATASKDATARVWEPISGSQLACMSGHRGDVRSVAFSSDGARLITTSRDHSARVWDVRTGACIAAMFGHRDGLKSASFCLDGSAVVTASFDATSRVWRARDGQSLVELSGHEGPIESAVFSPNGLRIATASRDGTTRIWDAKSGAQLHVLTGHTAWVTRATFSQDGTRIVTASDDGSARLWDALSGEQVATLVGHEDKVLDAAFSSDGTRIATASWDGSARIWDAACSFLIAALDSGGKKVRQASFSSDGARIVTALEDRIAAVWDYTDGGGPTLLRGHSGRVNSAEFCPVGNRIVTASDDGTARIWDARVGNATTVLRGHKGGLLNAKFCPRGALIVTTSHDKTCRVWDAETGRQLLSFDWVVDFAYPSFSPDGNFLVVGTEDGARVQDLRAPDSALTSMPGRTMAVVFGRAGPRALTTSATGSTARIWDLFNQREIAEVSWPANERWLGTATFSVDGFLVATEAIEGNCLRIWQTENGRLSCTLNGDFLHDTVFSADHSRVLTNSVDMAQLWDAGTGREIMPISAGTDCAAQFSLDGNRVATVAGRGILVWDSSKTSALTGEVVELIVSALANGLGFRCASERNDLLMQMVVVEDDDLCNALMTRLQERDANVALKIKKRADILGRNYHGHCYRPISEKLSTIPAPDNSEYEEQLKKWEPEWYTPLERLVCELRALRSRLGFRRPRS